MSRHEPFPHAANPASTAAGGAQVPQGRGGSDAVDAVNSLDSVDAVDAVDAVEAVGAAGVSGSGHPQRRPLASRTPQALPETATTSTLGGVTATPHTGSLPRIHIPLPTRTPAARLPGRQANLVVPGIPAQGGVSNEAESLPLGQAGTAVGGQGRARARFGRKPAAGAGAASAQNTAMSEPAKPAPKKSWRVRLRRAGRQGWLPNQHGAWAMMAVPFWVGVALSGFDWRHLPLFVLWLNVFALSHAVNLWMRTGRMERFWPPVRSYGLAALLIGAITLVAAPDLLGWALIFAPLVVTIICLAYYRRAETFLARSLEILSAGMLTLVTYDLGSGFQRTQEMFGWLQRVPVTSAEHLPVSPTAAIMGWPWVLLVALIITAYFWATIPYVKSLVRGRESASVWVGSIGLHLILTGLVTVAAALNWVSLWPVAVWVALTLRAWLVPAWAHRHGPVPIKRVGMAEFVATALVVASLFV